MRLTSLVLLVFAALAPQIFAKTVRPDCSLYDSGEILPDDFNIRAYFVCNGRRAIRHYCRKRLVFDPITKSCSYPRATEYKPHRADDDDNDWGHHSESCETPKPTACKTKTHTTPCTTPTPTPCVTEKLTKPCTKPTPTPCITKTLTTPCTTPTATPCVTEKLTKPCTKPTPTPCVTEKLTKPYTKPTPTPCVTEKLTKPYTKPTPTPCVTEKLTKPYTKPTPTPCVTEKLTKPYTKPTPTPCVTDKFTTPCTTVPPPPCKCKTLTPTTCTTTTTPCTPKNTTTPCETTTPPCKTVPAVGYKTVYDSDESSEEHIVRVKTSSSDCKDLPDGTYLVDAKRCYRFYVCLDGKVQNLKCPTGFWFDRDLDSCRPRHEVTNCK